MHTCTCVFPYVCMCTCLCWCACGRQMLTLMSSFPPFFLRHGDSLGPESCALAQLPYQGPPGSACLCLSVHSGIPCHTSSSMWVLWIPNQALVPAREHFTDWTVPVAFTLATEKPLFSPLSFLTGPRVMVMRKHLSACSQTS